VLAAKVHAQVHLISVGNCKGSVHILAGIGQDQWIHGFQHILLVLIGVGYSLAVELQCILAAFRKVAGKSL